MSEYDVVLVHGGWHGPWCWEAVEADLRTAGLRPRTVELPMRSLAEDAEVLRSDLGAKHPDRRVVVVGHSYAGAVVSSAGHQADRLVYVAAIALRKGQTITDSVGAGFGLVPGIAVDQASEETRLTAECMPYFYNLCDDATRDRVLGRLRPFGAACIFEAMAEPAAWESVPSTYVICTEDRVLPLDYQRARADEMQAQVEIVADHSPFASAEPALVDAIVHAAAQV
ncbi:alpha/beta fold hydrolase [Cryptosporangium aurantiacum]|uniref:Alpha/beta hydrolase family protein n=1 Tax=Cryptosporangium aurantiacum TaxID=134849 RepID=A0A1M7NJ89_9ACTN|nr:alpha/beta fold hydrolase [Cryptosporangium aurantiacum]SHN03923.1 Alpha/beta hydrolase family protein [Cryptosporangium aurantiacum]